MKNNFPQHADHCGRGFSLDWPGLEKVLMTANVKSIEAKASPTVLGVGISSTQALPWSTTACGG